MTSAQLLGVKRFDWDGVDTLRIIDPDGKSFRVAGFGDPAQMADTLLRETFNGEQRLMLVAAFVDEVLMPLDWPASFTMQSDAIEAWATRKRGEKA